MVFFWQCQGSRAGQTECNSFKILDVKAEGRGPCMRDPGPDNESDDLDDPGKRVKETLDVKAKGEVVKEETTEIGAGRADEHMFESKQEQEPGPPDVNERLVKEEPVKEEL